MPKLRPLHPLDPISSLADLHRAVPGVRNTRAIHSGPFSLLVLRVPWWYWLIPGRVGRMRKRLDSGLPVGTNARLRPTLW